MNVGGGRALLRVSKCGVLILVDEVQWSPLAFIEHASDVFTQNSYRDQLDASQKEHNHEQGRITRNGVTEQERLYDGQCPIGECAEGDRHAQVGRELQWHNGERSNA